VLFIADIFSMKSKSVFSTMFAVCGTLIIFVSSIIILHNGRPFDVQLVIRLFAGALTLLFLALMVYSIVIEVRICKERNTLITTGTYALTRHPGVLWFLLYYILGALFFENYDILIAGVIFTVVNVVYVILQEKYIFIKQFRGYEYYQQQTPMLIPNIKSIRRCIQTITGGQNEKIARDV